MEKDYGGWRHYDGKRLRWKKMEKDYAEAKKKDIECYYGKRHVSGDQELSSEQRRVDVDYNGLLQRRICHNDRKPMMMMISMNF